MDSIRSPWVDTFDQFAGSIMDSAIIAAPYISRRPVERLARKLGSRRKTVRLRVLTSLRPEHLIDQSVDLTALSILCNRVPGTTIRHLRNLHAKAYVADNHTAIVTSANLTYGGIWRNHELGIAVTDPRVIRDISDDLEEYGALGVPVPCHELTGLEDLAQQARAARQAQDSTVPVAPDQALAAMMAAIDKRLVALMTSRDEFVSDPKGSVNAQLADAILYVLRRHGPMPTREMHPLIQNLKPELCGGDSNLNYEFEGYNYGKSWKHDVRNAQQYLQRTGKIVLEKRKWRLSPEG